MKHEEHDELLVHHIRENWGPPDGVPADFEAAGRRVAARRKRNQRIRIGAAVAASVLALALIVRGRSAPSATDWLAYATSAGTSDLDLPPEYEALMGTIYSGERP